MSPLRVDALDRLLAAEIASLNALDLSDGSIPAKPREGAPVPAGEAVAAMRTLPVNAVAAALRYFEPIPARTNAIDLVKLAMGGSFAEAIAWLADSGIEPVETERVELAPPATKAEAMKRELVSAQLAGLACPAYRLTVMKRVGDDDHMAINLGKGETERVWSRDGVLALIPRLIQGNVTEGNIFVTPIHDGVEHVLIDDLDAAAVDAIRARGYRPAMIVESSPGSIQMVLKVAKSAAPREAINGFFKDMNRAYGDQKINGLTHPFRLVGFENRKPKHRDGEGRYPWVRLLHAENVLCSRAAQVVQAYR